MDYKDTIILSNSDNYKRNCIKIITQIDNELKKAYDLLDGISGIDSITRARDIIYNIRHDIEE